MYYLCRYSLLSYVLCLRRMSKLLKKRFPSVQASWARVLFINQFLFKEALF
jgi:hypothetical protein